MTSCHWLVGRVMLLGAAVTSALVVPPVHAQQAPLSRPKTGPRTGVLPIAPGGEADPKKQRTKQAMQSGLQQLLETLPANTTVRVQKREKAVDDVTTPAVAVTETTPQPASADLG